MPRYISLIRFRKQPTPEMVKQNLEMIEKDKQMGVKVEQLYWTLGRYDGVVIYDAPDEKKAIKWALERAENVAAETLVAIPLEEVKKLVE